jgi:hypothetical protein
MVMMHAQTSFKEIRKKHMLSMEEREAIMEANPPVVSGLHWAKTYFDWGWKGFGFGQLEVFLSKDGDLLIHNECMGRDRVRKILHAWADYIADRAMLTDTPEDVPPVNYSEEQEQRRKEMEEWKRQRGRE